MAGEQERKTGLTGGDVVGGDKINIDSIGAEAVAVGRNARAEINRYGDYVVNIDSLEKLENEPPKPGLPPYKGLTYFTEKDVDIFFGREELSDDLAAQLESTRFLAVVGASGSGKSSLLRAGVVPRLRRKNWQIHIITPTADPLGQLANSLTKDEEALDAADKMRDQLLAESQTLRRSSEKLTARNSAERFMLIVDQFEELYTLNSAEAERRAFVNNILAAVSSSGSVHILIGLRADFTGHLTEPEALRLLVNENFELLGPIQQKDLVRVIMEPAKRNGWAFVDGLVEQFLKEVGREPGRLPLLSHALLETWNRRSAHVMTLKGYREAGGIEGAIAKTAEDTFRQLGDDDKRAIMRDIFLALTEFGEGAEDTRRITKLESLARIGNETDVNTVLEALIKARLVTVDEDSIQVAHEVLIRNWERLRKWLEDSRERLRFERQLERDACEWVKQLNRDPGALYRGARLAWALEFLEGQEIKLGKQVTEFLKASRALRMDELERQREIAEREKQLRAEAERQGKIGRRALARQLANDANNILKEDEPNYDLALLLAKEAVEVTYRNPPANPDGYVHPNAFESLVESVKAAPPWLMNLPRQRHDGVVSSAAFSPDGALIVTASDDKTAKVWDAASGQALRTLSGHGKWVNAAAFSPDGALIVTASDDKTAKVWDAESGEELHTLSGHGDWVNTAAFSPDGALIVTASDDKTAKVWDTASGQALRTLSGHGDWVRSAAFSPDGTLIATASSDKTAKVWDAASGQALRTLSGHGKWVNTAAFSPDGALIVTASDDNTAKVWDAASGQALRTLSGHGKSINSAAFSPDGALIFTDSGDGTAKVWDAASGEEVRILSGHGKSVASAAYSPDGRLIVTGSKYGTAKVWEMASGEEVRILSGHGVWVVSAAFSPDGARIVTGSSDKTAKVWDAASGQELATLGGHGYWVRSAAYSPDGRLIVTGSQDGSAKLWEMASGLELRALSGHGGQVFSAAFSPDGALIVSGSGDETAKVWDAASGEALCTLSGHGDTVTSAAFNPDGARIVTGSKDTTAKVWDVASGEELRTLSGHGGPVFSAAFSPDGARIVTSSGDWTAEVWDTTSGQELRTLSGHGGPVFSAAFSPDGARIVTGSEDKTAKVWDAASGEALCTLSGHRGSVFSAAFSPNRARIVTGSEDKTAKVWDAASGQELATLSGHEYDVSSVAFSPDGRLIVTGSRDGTARTWYTTYDLLLAKAESLVQRYYPGLTPEEREQFELN